MQDVVAALIAAGAHVVVHTTRKADDIGPWLAAHYNLSREYVYNEKWSRIDVFVDDRAMCFGPHLVADQAARDMFVEALTGFEPHWRIPRAPAGGEGRGR
jgi:hypothetical protein